MRTFNYYKMKYILAILFTFIITFSFGQAKTNLDLKKLNGSWISTDDKNYHITIKDATWKDYYEKNVTTVLDLKINKNNITAKDKKSGEIYKYEIVKLNDKQLSLIYLDRGNTLSFKRKP